MTHPYESVPDYARWRRAFAFEQVADIDPVVSFPLKITADDKIATAGSCFAQHIARYLRQSNFSVLITEPAHPLLSEVEAAAYNYGVYAARYGNIYTSRQLLQLFQRALGRFDPIEDYWKEGDVYLDPLRPTIQPGGFSSLEEYHADRRQHLAAVRRAMEQLDVLVFTFGLTESWVNRTDGMVYPICPGVAGGVFDPQRCGFINLTVDKIVADMSAAINLLREVNPSARVILTVSPVPLVATAEDRHVLVSTTYSKSVLRVAAEELAHVLSEVHYFPSYEIITGNYSRGSYFADDLRSIREDGVQHVMALFFRHATAASSPIQRQPAIKQTIDFDGQMEKVMGLLCDEELLDALPDEGRLTNLSPTNTKGLGRRIGRLLSRLCNRNPT